MLTGAGISLASGIPTFRGSDPGAIWARDITELATLRYFTSDPVGAWRWYRERFLRVLAARPNQAHHALAALERWHARRRRDFLVVTQNIDTLHERAGSTRVVKVHGSADRCRCSDPACRLGAVESIALDDMDFADVRSGSPRRRHSLVPGLRHSGSPTRAVVRRALCEPRRLPMARRRRGRGTDSAADLCRYLAGRRRDLVPPVGGSRR